MNIQPRRAKPSLLTCYIVALSGLALTNPVAAATVTIASGTTTNDGATVDGDDTVVISGPLTVTGGSGINATGNGNTVNLLAPGSIITSGANADGIDSTGDNNTATVTGSIATNGANSQGVVNIGDDNTTTIAGSLTTAATNSQGVFNGGDNNDAGYRNTSIITGSIVTNGDGSVGVFNKGENTTTVFGSIVTTNQNAHGVQNEGSNTTRIEAGGRIATSGVGSHGIDNLSSTATTIVGTVTTTGANSSGVVNFGVDARTDVRGSISTTGVEAYGVANVGDASITTVAGRIATTGLGSFGIYTAGNDNAILVSGSVATRGQSGHGIVNIGDNNTVTVRGSVMATGADSVALYQLAGAANRLTLGPGARVSGSIVAHTAATASELTFDVGASASYALTVSGQGEGTGAGQWRFTDLDNRSQGITTDGSGCADILGADITTCNRVVAVGMGAAEAQDKVLYMTQAGVRGSLRLGQHSAPEASWIDLYHGNYSGTEISPVDARSDGLSLVTPVVTGAGPRIDVVLNTSNTDLRFGPTAEQQLDRVAYKAGVVMRKFAVSRDWSLDAYGLAGRTHYQSERQVMNNLLASGYEVVTSSYSSTEVAAGIHAHHRRPLNPVFSVTTTVNAGLNHERVDAHRESKYFAWDARTMLQGTAAIGAGLDYQRDALEAYVSVGLERVALVDGESLGYTTNGTDATYQSSRDSTHYRLARAGFTYTLAGNLHITGAVDVKHARGDLDGSTLRIGAAWAF